MTAQQILNWLELKQGSARASDIRGVWAAFPDEGCVTVRPNSKLERIGLKNGQTYTLITALQAIGCDVDEAPKWGGRAHV